VTTLPLTHAAPRRSRPFRAMAAGSALLLLGGCVTTQSGRIGADDGTDSCRPQLVALDSTGNFFAEDIIKGAVIGAVGGALIGGLASGSWRGAAAGAAAGALVGGATGYFAAVQQQRRDQAGIFTQVKGDLSNENAQLDRTQAAFDNLTNCRFQQARTVRADLQAGRITRDQAQSRMAVIRSRYDRDVQLARSINGQITGRQEQFAEAAENLSPGSKAQIEQRRAVQPRRYTIAAATPLKVSPDAQAGEVSRLNAREQVTIKTQRDGFALVETADGRQGFVPVSAVQGGVRATPVVASGGGAAATGDAGEVRTLAATNAAKRDNFNDSIAVAERAASSGFELS
jgi:outer membrane lipoprotein SlyB